MATNHGDRGADSPALLREVARLHVRAQRALLACESASATRCTILTELGRGTPMTLAALARRLRLDKSWTSRAVDRLVDEGLVDKAMSDADRRTVDLSLTRRGVARHRRLEAMLDDQVTRIIERIPRSQRSGVAHALQLLHAAYVAELSQPERAEPVEGAGASHRRVDDIGDPKRLGGVCRSTVIVAERLLEAAL